MPGVGGEGRSGVPARRVDVVTWGQARGQPPPGPGTCTPGCRGRRAGRRGTEGRAGKGCPCGVPGWLGRAGLQGRGRFVRASLEVTNTATTHKVGTGQRFIRLRGSQQEAKLVQRRIPGTECSQPTATERQDRTGEQRRATHYGATTRSQTVTNGTRAWDCPESRPRSARKQQVRASPESWIAPGGLPDHTQ